jgi:hypothetical protein
MLEVSGTVILIRDRFKRMTCKALADKGLVKYKCYGNVIEVTDLRKESGMKACEIDAEDRNIELAYTGIGNVICGRCGHVCLDTDAECEKCGTELD